MTPDGIVNPQEQRSRMVMKKLSKTLYTYT